METFNTFTLSYMIFFFIQFKKTDELGFVCFFFLIFFVVIIICTQQLVVAIQLTNFDTKLYILEYVPTS